MKASQIIKKIEKMVKIPGTKGEGWNKKNHKIFLQCIPIGVYHLKFIKI